MKTDQGETFDPAEVAAHIAQERRSAALLGEVREVIFGAQDGLISTLAVVSAVGGATGETFSVLVAGLAATLAGVFSMAAGEYMSSKSQREVYNAQIRREQVEVEERPTEALLEVRYLFEEEGIPPEDARIIAEKIARVRPALLKTMVEKELKLVVAEETTPLQGAFWMGLSFGLAALVPILPYLLLPVGTALAASILLTGLALFLIGAVKARFTEGNALLSGLEIVALGTAAGLGSYLFGTVLPGLFGVRAG
jgi:VIT1/CCC1 family predicted Fe2+/Mn2+ transporter